MNRYAVMSNELIQKARRELAEGDLLQASEKGWGAAAHAVNAVAERRGWRHDSHRALYEAVARLVRGTGDQEIGTFFGVAQAMHMNFYENWHPLEIVEANIAAIEALVAKLGALDT